MTTYIESTIARDMTDEQLVLALLPSTHSKLCTSFAYHRVGAGIQHGRIAAKFKTRCEAVLRQLAERRMVECRETKPKSGKYRCIRREWYKLRKEEACPTTE